MANFFETFLLKVLLRWLDRVFRGQYLPSLSVNYVVVINRDLEKLPPHLYYISLDQIKKKTFVMIRVAMTLSCHSNKMTQLPIGVVIYAQN